LRTRLRPLDYAAASLRSEYLEVGSRTRRRPIGRDYAAAKDAEFGKEKQMPTELEDFGIEIAISSDGIVKNRNLIYIHCNTLNL
jgi:hypothetical protein